MNDASREALAVLQEVWALSPEVRLGQLMSHLGFLAEAHLGKGLADIEDDELIAILYRHRLELIDRLQGNSPQNINSSNPVSISGSSTLPDIAPSIER